MFSQLSLISSYLGTNFRRRKVRTTLMVLALLISIGLMVTMNASVEAVRQSNVDLIIGSAGRYDLTVSKRDTSRDPYLPIDEVRQAILGADERIRTVYPRIHAPISFRAADREGAGFLVALDPTVDDIGNVEVLEGAYELGGGGVAVLEETAIGYGLHVGDVIEVAYEFPVPRSEGEAAAGPSQRRTTTDLVITGVVRQHGVVGGGVREGILMHLEAAQSWLGLPGRAQSLVATVDPALYEASNAEAASLLVRDVVGNVQQRLGDGYRYQMDKALVLTEAADEFLVLQTLIGAYGFLTLGVVGLLIYTLVMTNVQEQRRDLAVLHILGARRSYLFMLVIAEAFVLGVVGVALGVGLGYGITHGVVVPLLQRQMQSVGIDAVLTPHITPATALPVVAGAFVVLLLSSLRPAQEAARTRVTHAINPSVADNIQLEDLAELRQRRPDLKLSLAGLSLVLIFALLVGLGMVETFGSPSLTVVFFLIFLGLLVFGLGLMFFITTVPFERLVLMLIGLVQPRLVYFARRNVARGKTRNTLISLLVLFSGVLPSFLATQLALSNANFETTVRQSMGAPATLQAVIPETARDADRYRLRPSFLTDEVAKIPGVARSAGLTHRYSTEIADAVDFRRAPVTVVGVAGDVGGVVFDDLVDWTAGGPDAFAALRDDPTQIVISEGLAQHLAVSLGDTLRLSGAGFDHVVEVVVAGIVRSLPGLSGMGRSANIAAQSGSTLLLSVEGFRALLTPLGDPLPSPDDPILERVFMMLDPDVPVQEVAEAVGTRFGEEYALRARFVALRLQENRQEQVGQRIFLLLLTTIAFSTSIFGVFAVVYVSIHSRRVEIGMLKAIGMQARELTGMFVVEGIAMTLGAALAGITAGSTMAYIMFYQERFLAQQPTTFAVDTTVVPYVVILGVCASILAAVLSARRLVRQRAVEILRT